MHRFDISRSLLRTALMAALAVAGACSDGGSGPDTPEPPGPGKTDLNLAVAVSSESAKPGERVVLAVRASSAEKLLGLQGTLHFDASKLRFLGQDPADGRTLAMVNADEAGRGSLVYLASNPMDGLTGHVAPLAFEVLGAGYAAELRYTLQMAVVGNERETTRAAIAARPELAASLKVPGNPRRLGVPEWALLLDPKEKLAEGLSLSPGQRRTDGGRYGDVNNSGTFTTIDISTAARAAVGQPDAQLIVGTDSAGAGAAANRDLVIGANVRPIAAGGNPIGGADPNRVINVTDVQALQATFVGGGTDPQGVVNTPIRPADNAGCSNLIVPAGTQIGNITWNVQRPCFVRLDGVVRIGGNSEDLAGGVDSSATLTITAGTVVKGNAAIVAPTAVYVQRNGRIVAIGTAANPIEFSCDAATPTPACFGGVFIAGNATVNEQQAGVPAAAIIDGRNPSAGGNTRQGEGGAPAFGGSNDADSSGVLRYVRIEYAGFTLSLNNELNCLTLAGVGSGTDIDHIQCDMGSDDAFEMFGGTVDLRFMYASNNQDDNIDVSFGYNGRIQYVIVYQSNPTVANNDKGIEADGTETLATFNNERPTIPEIYNVTFVRNVGGTADAFHIRRGARAEIGHVAVLNYGIGMDIDDVESCQDLRQTTNGLFTTSHDNPGPYDSLVVHHSRFAMAAGGSVGNSDTDPACNGYTSPNVESEHIGNPAFANDITPALATDLLIAPFSTNPDFRPKPGQLTVTGASLPGARPNHIAFDPLGASFYGAVAPAPITQNAVPWYAGWTRHHP